MKFVSGRSMRAVGRSAAFCMFLAAGSALAATPALAGWDSIAVDDDTATKGGDAGYGVGTADSKAAAESEAMKTCKSEGNKGCAVEVSYKDMCGAYVSSKKYSGHGTGATKAAAT
ncbi:MAG TPA: DUF4189 domain-containing protein, partial [Rhizomicrobium sp.]|nr:DUF4189 domain-containing protein [Rhizomicrobium sp.]